MDGADFAHRVVASFRRFRRDLPWRQTRDPYAIWVSEIMLQQTRVATVIPYFERWMERFPSISALAEAELDDVLAAWSGLGYYRRARNLHRGAREVASRYGGSLPGSARELRALPGVGRYTAGAIASVAYGEKAPVVDGNVARVLSRVYCVEGDLKAPATSRRLWELAGALVPAEAPGDFNQGLMELGATVCTPTRPGCEACPVNDLCRARAAGRERELPATPRRKRASELPLVATAAAWIERRGRILLARRPAQGLFGGLWELPQVEGDAGTLREALGEAAEIEGSCPVTTHRQTLSHRRLAVEVYRAGPGPARPAALARRLRARYDRVAWHPVDTLETYAVAAATRAIYRHLSERRGWKRTTKPSATSKRGIKKSSRDSASSDSSRRATKTSGAPRPARPKASPS